MILYEWVFNRGEVTEGVFCSAQCATDTYADNPRTYYKGGPSPLDEQESRELANDWKVCYGCGKPFDDLPVKMATERWFTLVEFTFDVDTEPSKLRHEGDAQVDFASRAFVEGLDKRLREVFPGNDGINWTVIAQQVGNERHLAKRES